MRIPSNAGRFLFIEQIEQLVPGSETLKIWGNDRRSWAIRFLTAPGEEDIPLFIKLAKADKEFMARE